MHDGAKHRIKVGKNALKNQEPINCLDSDISFPIWSIVRVRSPRTASLVVSAGLSRTCNKDLAGKAPDWHHCLFGDRLLLRDKRGTDRDCLCEQRRDIWRSSTAVYVGTSLVRRICPFGWHSATEGRVTVESFRAEWSISQTPFARNISFQTVF